MKPHLLASFGPLPDIHGPSGRIYWRHLQRFLHDGWDVTVTALDCRTSCPIAGAKILNLPSRRRWWPPVRTGFKSSVSLRNKLLAGYAAAQLATRPPDLVLAGGGHPHIDLARRLAARFAVPFHLILHDWWTHFCATPDDAALAAHLERRTFPAATCIWAVSPELAAEATKRGARQPRVLLPIPEGFPRPEPPAPRPAALKLVALGSYGRAHAPVYRALARRAARVGGTLVIGGPQADQASNDLSDEPNVITLPYGPLSSALHYASQSSAIVVAQPLPPADHPWTLTSFPSKLLEFAHTGRPLLIMADPSSAVGRWALASNWQPYAANLSDTSIDQALTHLNDPAHWHEAAARTLAAAKGAFAPDEIHNVLRDGMLASLRSPAWTATPEPKLSALPR